MLSNHLAPKISVIMPVYNAGKYLRDAIDSILNQTFSEFELFIIDDKSTDNSLEIIKTYKDNRIILIEKPINTGYTDSLNMTIKLARGKYIARMDADDMSVKDRFQKQYDYMEANPNLLLLGSYYQIIGKEKVFKYPTSYEAIKVFSLTQNPVPHPTALIRASVLREYNLSYNKNFEPAEDFELWTRIINIGRVENLADICLYYRQHEEQISNIKRERQLAAADNIRITQLNSLVDFSNITYNKELILNLLTKRMPNINVKTLVDLKNILNFIYKENKIKHLYDVILLKDFLRSIWLHYVYSVYDYNLYGIIAISPFVNSSVTKMDFKFRTKFLIKSIIRYK